MSFVWSYFNKINGKEEAQCLKCVKTFNCKGSSTSALIKHLKNVHKISKSDEKGDKTPCGEPPQKKLKQTMIITKTNKPSRSEIISKLVAEDGLTIAQVQKSSFIREGIKRLYDYDLPKSSTTIMKEVHNFSGEKQKEITETLSAAVNKGCRFSLSFDEWTSKRGRRYCNINLHTEEDKYCLGIARVYGSMTSEKTQKILRENLEKFGISLDDHVIASICDGARVNLKYGRENESELQVCYAHGIHLAVTGVLYKKANTNHTENQFFSEESEDDSLTDNELDNFEDQVTPDELKSQDAKLSVSGVRRIVKMFKRSDLRNQVLQGLIKEEFGHEIALKLDCRTR